MGGIGRYWVVVGCGGLYWLWWVLVGGSDWWLVVVVVGCDGLWWVVLGGIGLLQHIVLLLIIIG